MKPEKFSGNGDYSVTTHSDTLVSIQTTDQFNVVVNDDLRGPASSTDRFLKLTLYKDQSLEMLTVGRYTITFDVLPDRNEINTGDKLVELIDDSEISLEDRLRAQMMAELSRLADKQNLDSFTDDDDFDDDFEDDNLSQYEKKEMIEEYLDENQLTADELLNPKIKNSAPQDNNKKTEAPLEKASEASEAN